jgi:hypothetical protein
VYGDPAPGRGDEPLESAAVPARSFDLTAWLDSEFGGIWERGGLEVARCDDGAFLRRVYLDLVGRIPSVAEAREFLADDASDKRSRIVDQLLTDDKVSARNSEYHAEHFARLWRRIMLPPGAPNVFMGRQFEPWLVAQFRENVPYDELARRLVTARGAEDAQASAYYAAVGGTPESYADAFTRVFLGVQIGCAQCHDHPFADWKQSDFWGVAAFFSGTSQENGQPFTGGALEERHVTTITHEEVEYAARFLGGDAAEVPPSRLPREVLAEWMTSRSNRRFAATAVNRIWQHLYGRGLAPEVDNIDAAGGGDEGRLLEELSQRFADSGYDLRWLISGICRSRVYQAPAAGPGDSETSSLAGRRPLKSLTPEQTFDSLEQSLMLPVTRTNSDSARHNGMRDQIVARLDESAGGSPENYAAGIPQALLLMHGRLTDEATRPDRSRTLRGVIAAPFLDAGEKIDALFLATVTRWPTAQEQAFMRAHVERAATDEDRSHAYSEVFWALLNSPEFALCR